MFIPIDQRISESGVLFEITAIVYTKKNNLHNIVCKCLMLQSIFLLHCTTQSIVRVLQDLTILIFN